MKKFILTLGLIAALSSTVVSCSTDDSALTDDSNSLIVPSTTGTIDNGDKDLPKPPIKG